LENGTPDGPLNGAVGLFVFTGAAATPYSASLNGLEANQEKREDGHGDNQSNPGHVQPDNLVRSMPLVASRAKLFIESQWGLRVKP
jgi:hypothetical protein